MKKELRKRWVSGIILIVFLTILDRLTKLWAAKTLTQGFDIAIISGVLELHYLENTGAAFSILTGKTGFLGLLTIVMCVFIVFLMIKTPLEKKYSLFWLCLVFLFSGALGNFYDRIFYHYVIDFISFVLINFPIFNVADIYVTVSMALLVVLILFYYDDEALGHIFKSEHHSDD
mgnify:CR=1 FL=1